jgi:hypothetical protein
MRKSPFRCSEGRKVQSELSHINQAESTANIKAPFAGVAEHEKLEMPSDSVVKSGARIFNALNRHSVLDQH